MTLKQNKEGEKLTVYIEGGVDSNTAPKLQEALEKEIPSIKELLLDFKDVDYISSAGLRVLLFAHKKMAPKGKMEIAHVSPEVMEIFEVTSFDTVLNII